MIMKYSSECIPLTSLAHGWPCPHNVYGRPLQRTSPASALNTDQHSQLLCTLPSRGKQGTSPSTTGLEGKPTTEIQRAIKMSDTAPTTVRTILNNTTSNEPQTVPGQACPLAAFTFAALTHCQSLALEQRPPGDLGASERSVGSRAPNGDV